MTVPAKSKHIIWPRKVDCRSVLMEQLGLGKYARWEEAAPRLRAMIVQARKTGNLKAAAEWSEAKAYLKRILIRTCPHPGCKSPISGSTCLIHRVFTKRISPKGRGVTRLMREWIQSGAPKRFTREDAIAYIVKVKPNYTYPHRFVIGNVLREQIRLGNIVCIERTRHHMRAFEIVDKGI